MTPQQIVKERWPEAYCEWQYMPNQFYYIMYGYRCLGSGNTESEAWENALKNLEHE